MAYPSINAGYNPIADAEIRREREADMREQREALIAQWLREGEFSISDDDAAETLGDMDGEEIISAIRQACEHGNTAALHQLWERLVERTSERLA
ncbi:hypothetical protein [Halorhodospira halophila]|uniref:hypothetical protein n=1 Tax=Halorhodospira halophila TaxID=1053 RepID=UPI0019137028|nr:hypothetical protein [Halorhodospira halophila]MBK5942743.1 hypothetical protein [Halorhodospira halophila]